MARNKGIQDDETQAVEQAADEVGVPLPDIKQALQRKAIEKEMTPTSINFTFLPEEILVLARITIK